MARPRQRAGNSHLWAEIYSTVGNRIRVERYELVQKLVDRGVARWLDPLSPDTPAMPGQMAAAVLSGYTRGAEKGSDSDATRATILMSESIASASLAAAVQSGNTRGPYAPSHTYGLSEQRRIERLAANRCAEDFAERSYLKVQAWPSVGDTKAVRVGPRA